MHNNIRGTLGVSDTAIRVENDYYPTDPIAAEWLIKLETLSENIWECACGEGHLAKVFAEHGYKVKSTDLVDRGFGEGGGLPLGDAGLRRRYYYKSTFYTS